MSYFQTLTIGKRLFLSSAALLALTAIAGGICLFEASSLEEHLRGLVVDSLPGFEESSTILQAVLQIRGNSWRHIGNPSATDKEEMEARNQAADLKAREAIRKYQSTIVTAEDRALFSAVAPLYDRYLQAWHNIRQLSRDGKTAQAADQYTREVAQTYAALSDACFALQEYNRKAANQRSSLSRQSLARIQSWISGVLLVTLVLGVGISLLFTRSTNRLLRTAAEELSTASEQVASAASQVASASQSLAQGSSQQAAAVEQTSATSQEVTSMARQNAENSQQASGMMQSSQETAEKMKTAVNDLSASMHKIDASSGKISAIIRVIDEIAFQTNILALNAAVEAARAGDAGMGFAVVADEVRNLAQRSAQAAKDTASLIESAVSDTSHGSRKVQEVVEAMKRNAEIGVQVTALVDQITAASREQATGVEQISRAMSHIEQATQKAAASAEESAAASQELTAQAAAMRQVVQRMRQLSGVGRA